MNRCIVLLAVVGLAGCVEPSPPREVRGEPRVVYVVEAPPAEQVEIVPAPRYGYVWVRGHYTHQGRHYEWSPGYWEPVRPRATYETGRWDRSSRGYIWIEGRWH